jgi:hypothetical protein
MKFDKIEVGLHFGQFISQTHLVNLSRKMSDDLSVAFDCSESISYWKFLFMSEASQSRVVMALANFRSLQILRPDPGTTSLF